MNSNIRARLIWVKLYQETGNAGLVCRRCGISRPTLRKWYRRYQEHGLEGLHDRSRKPYNSPNKKITVNYEKIILDLRIKRKLGARRIRNELLRHYEITFSLATIHKVLTRNNVGLMKRLRRKKQYKRYQRPIPGDRVQMDTMKVGPGIFQYTAIDDCTRFRVLGLYERRTAANTLLFIERVIEEMPFPIQRFQTDRGAEFFALKVQKYLLEHSIKFRPIKPASPHLNGKVERSQKTDIDEFYSTADLQSPDLEQQIEEWQFFYNWHRPHGSLKGASPIDKVCDLGDKTPYWEEIYDYFDSTKEGIQERNYRLETKLRQLKRCL